MNVRVCTLQLNTRAPSVGTPLDQQRPRASTIGTATRGKTQHHQLAQSLQRRASAGTAYASARTSRAQSQVISNSSDEETPQRPKDITNVANTYNQQKRRQGKSRIADSEVLFPIMGSPAGVNNHKVLSHSKCSIFALTEFLCLFFYHT